MVVNQEVVQGLAVVVMEVGLEVMQVPVVVDQEVVQDLVVGRRDVGLGLGVGGGEGAGVEASLVVVDPEVTVMEAGLEVVRVLMVADLKMVVLEVGLMVGTVQDLMGLE